MSAQAIGSAKTVRPTVKLPIHAMPKEVSNAQKVAKKGLIVDKKSQVDEAQAASKTKLMARETTTEKSSFHAVA